VQVLSRWRSSEPHRPRVMRSCPRGHQRSVDRGAVAVTGFWSEGDESLIGKRLELLKHAAPHISRVGVMVNPDDASDARPLDALPAAAPPWVWRSESSRCARRRNSSPPSPPPLAKGCRGCTSVKSPCSTPAAPK
jgi:hypothetical protein